MKKILSFLGVFFLSINLSGSILINSNELSNTLKLKQNENHNLKQKDFFSKTLQFQKLFPPKYDNSCGLSAFQTTINYLDPHSTITQEQIFHELSERDAVIGKDGIDLNGRATQYLASHTRRPYNLHIIERNTAKKTAKRKWFRNFLISNLERDIPIVVGVGVFHPNVELRSRHALIIYGIRQDEATRSTIFETIDNGVYNTITENDFWGLNGFDEIRVIGVEPEQENPKKKISIKTKAVDFFGSLFSKKSRETRLDINLSDAGIYSLSDLQTFKKLNIDGFQMKYDWFDNHAKWNQESWQTKYFNFEKHDWEKDNDKSLSYKEKNIARNDFETYYRSNLYQEDNHDLILSLQYKFQALTQLTTTWPLLTVVLGSIITLSVN